MVKNTKAKIRRSQKNYGVNLISEVKLPALESFTSREKFNEWKTNTESFLNRANTNYRFKKNQHGVVATKKLLNQIQRDLKVATRLAQERLKRLPEKQKQQIHVYMKPPSYFGVNIPTFNFGNIRSSRQLHDKANFIKREADPMNYTKKAWQMKQNFMTALSQIYNSDSSNVVDMIEKMHPEIFVELYKEHMAVLDFAHFIPSDQEREPDDDLARVIGLIQDYEDGKIELDLKEF